MTATKDHFDNLQSKFGSTLLEAEVSEPNQINFRIAAANLLDVMQYIKDELNFPSLESIAGVDWETHYEIVYHIDRWDGDPTVIQVKVQIDDHENPAIPSISTIWRSADWHERELYDLYGVMVENHPNLKRILLPEEWDTYEHTHISALFPMRRAYQLPEKPYAYKPKSEDEA